jgi:DNA mismatch repair ATPase MutS
MQESNMPFCRPEIARTEDRDCIVHNVYNISLALHMLQQGENPAEMLVLNDVKFDESGRIQILTGPNRGGKTVYTEAVGLMQVLFQAGVFVPGSHASISPVDSIYSHFPADENQTIGLGRLGEETKRLNEIFQQATDYSLILLNESLSSTSFTEGLYIAQDIVKAFRYLGARVIFNTHMHELAANADTINQDIEGTSKVVSLVTGITNGKRSYKIQQGAPLGKSYAMDIAMKYGLSYAQIIETIDKKQQIKSLD